MTLAQHAAYSRLHLEPHHCPCQVLRRVLNGSLLAFVVAHY